VNAVLLRSVLHRSEFVPRAIPAVGLIGAPLLAASATAPLFGVLDQFSVAAAIGALPIALWELSLGIWLMSEGFQPQATTGAGSVDAVRIGVQPAEGLVGSSSDT
jgi:hypothetical protein